MKCYKRIRTVPIHFVVLFTGLIFAQNDVKEKIMLLNSTTAAVRLSAIQELSILQTDDAINALVEHLKKEKDNYLKIQIIESLNVETSTVAFSAVVDAIYDKNSYVRQSAVRQLGYSSKPEKVLPVIEKLLNEEKDKSVKMTAINTLSLYKTTTTVEIIDKIVADKTADKDLRLLAVHLLGKIGTKEAKNKLQKYLADTDPEVREKVKSVLRKKK